MQWTNEEKQEWLDYIFQHNYNRVEQTAKRLGKKRGQFSLNILSNKGEVPRSEHAVPDQGATMEFGLAISRFALPESWYNIDLWLIFLRGLAGEKHISEFDRLERKLQQIREGGMALKLNRENITDSKAYEMLARGVVFADDLAASAYNQWLLKQGLIIYNALWEKYNSYCVGLWDFMQEIQEYRKKQGIRPAPVERKNNCIYCKRTDGKFDHVEHIIPESLGNEYVFLPKGFVCSDCMNELSKLEDGINEMSHFSMVLVNTSTGNKKGKLPYLKSPELHIQKKSPNELIFRSFGKEGEIMEKPLEHGGHKITITASGRFDAHRIARMLYKAALGAIALEKCHEVALDPSFDEIRRYIIGGGTFPNNMALSKKGFPSLPTRVEWYEVEGVPKAKLVILGFTFAIILGEKPKLDPAHELEPVIIFDLSLEKPESAVVHANDE